MTNLNDLINDAVKTSIQIQRLKDMEDFWYNIFMKKGGWDNYTNFNDAQKARRYYEEYYMKLSLEYDEKYSKNKISDKIYYAITIGSAEKDNIKPCLDLYNKFKNSADGKKCLDTQAFFEKGKNGYIHIHLLTSRTEKWARSFKQLSLRYGKYKGKQHNFDIKRLKTSVDVIKWKNYIKKDANDEWNKKVNQELL